MLHYILPIAGALALLGGTVAVLFMAFAIRTAVKAKPDQLEEVRVEFSPKRKVIMRWQGPAPPSTAESARPRLVRGKERA